MYNFLKNLNFNYNEVSKESYSQSGEDAIVDFWINKKNGTYIDIGANDPIYLNNTFKFYRMGWRGINLEPNPIEIQKIKKHRPLDTNLQLGISQSRRKLTYYKFEPSTLSTFSKSESENYIKQGYILKDQEKIDTITLKEVFEKYIPDNNVDLLSIDVEGYEENVISSNDWNLYRPTMVILETVNHNPIYKKNIKFDNIMRSHNYIKFADTFINTIYASSEFYKVKNIRT